MIELICFAASVCTIAYGGYMDYKKREIPDAVPIVLILASLPKGVIPVRLLITILALLILLLAERLSKQELPGGDLKLICAVMFANGPAETLVILLFGSWLYGSEPCKKTAVETAYSLMYLCCPSFHSSWGGKTDLKRRRNR